MYSIKLRFFTTIGIGILLTTSLYIYSSIFHLGSRTNGQQASITFKIEVSNNSKINPKLRCRAYDELNCAQLFDSKTKSRIVDAAKNFTNPGFLDLNKFIEESQSGREYCQTFKAERRYITEPLTKEEADFSIAYSILVYKDVALFERLFQAIYRPQNYYCVHVDRSSSDEIYATVRSIVKCFHNVFFPRDAIDVVHSTFSVLEADLLCMRELLAYKNWKYFINLTGQEYPLQSTLAIVKILKAFKGANNIAGSVKYAKKSRYRKAGGLPKVNVTLTKGSVHIIATREFVLYAIYNESAIKFLSWVKKTEVPDETFFSSLNHSPQLGVPGAYRGVPETSYLRYPFFSRYKNWRNQSQCFGKYERSICIPGVGDLVQLARRRELFVNKFNQDFEPAAIGCMEELVCNRTRDELAGERILNMSRYSQFNFTWNHV